MYNNINFYKKKYDLEQRIENSNLILKNNKEIYPIIIQPYNFSNFKNEYYILKLKVNLSTIKLILIIKEKEVIKEDESLYFLIIEDEKQQIINNKSKIKELYKKYKDEDGFLYIYYSKYEAFGKSSFIN